MTASDLLSRSSKVSPAASSRQCSLCCCVPVLCIEQHRFAGLPTASTSSPSPVPRALARGIVSCSLPLTSFINNAGISGPCQGAAHPLRPSHERGECSSKKKACSSEN
jgi:hypothetical protein